MELEKTLHSDLVALDDSALDGVAGGFFFPVFDVNVNTVNFADNQIAAGDDVNITIAQG